MQNNKSNLEFGYADHAPKAIGPRTASPLKGAHRIKHPNTNLADPVDQLKIHQAVYLKYLQDQEVPQSSIKDLTRLHSIHITKQMMATLFPLPISDFHIHFIKYLTNL